MNFDNIDMSGMKIRRVYTRTNPKSGAIERFDKNIRVGDIQTRDEKFKEWQRGNPDTIISDWLSELKTQDVKNLSKKFISSMNGDKPTGSTIEFIGSSKSGKTFLMITMLHYFLSNKEYKNKVIPVFVTPNFNAPAYDDIRDYVEDGSVMIVENLRNLSRLLKIMFTINKHLDLHYKFILFIDDVISMNLQKNVIEDLFLTKRNMNISTLMGVQTDTVSSKKSRNNANYIVFKRFANDVEIEDMINKYMKSYFPQLNRMDNHLKIELYKKLIENYNSILLDNLDNELYYLKSGK